jgi:hypothetical protein
LNLAAGYTRSILAPLEEYQVCVPANAWAGVESDALERTRLPLSRPKGRHWPESSPA